VAFFGPDPSVTNRKKGENADHQGNDGHLDTWHIIVLLILLIAPGLAIHRLSAFISLPWLLGYAASISLLTYAVYGADKDSAQEEVPGWRAPEKLLHGLEFAGGWPGAFLAQRRLRHKCSKFSYQVKFWLIVFLHVYLATDYVLGWAFARWLASLVFHRAAPP
jgi:uncharacterized membrane protein YsdA (DUF1294 family)